MLLRPFEALVPREEKAECLQRGFNLLATEQVNGKEKLWDSAVVDRCTTDSDSESGNCLEEGEDNLHHVRDW